MANSNITKQALSNALKELMEEVPFDKIRIADICNRCNMNRKSFYYHFKDKYDLLNWIFDTEFISFAKDLSQAEELDEHVDALQNICNYFYENRYFYRKALQTEGQNSFPEHFREYVMPIIKLQIEYLFGDSEDEFTLNFFTDVAVATIERWLLDKNCMAPDDFLSKLMHVVQQGAKVLNDELNKTE
ncbi:MAG TPA: TetR family transcriptional regulator [Anaerolineaceae bacterium]|nr:TetR family transcriptional regulator [Anaerolineaceae bacterium]